MVAWFNEASAAAAKMSQELGLVKLRRRRMGDTSRGVGVSAVTVAVTIACLWIGAVGARAAASPLAWSRSVSVEPFYSGGAPGGFTGISCASSSFCAAVDGHGFVLTSRDPTAGASSWTPVLVDTGVYSLRHVSCPTTSLCVAIDGGSTIYSSSNPAGGSGAWTATQIAGVFGLESVSCPSTSLCVATEQSGHVITSTNPTGGAGAWTVADVDASQPITDVSCPPGTTTCVAIDEAQHVLTSTNPTGGAAAWNTTTLGGTPFYNGVLTCESTSLCVAVGGSQIFASTDPTGGSGAWTVGGLPAGIADLRSLACPSSSLCVLVGDAASGSPSGDMAVSANPTGGTAAWTVSKSAAAPATLSPIACPSTSLCVALADNQFLTSTNPGTGASSYAVSRLSTSVAVLGVACVTSTSLCVGVDSLGNVAHTTDQYFGSTLYVASDQWSSVNVAGTPLEAVACPTASLCVAVDDNGEIFSATNPTGGAGAWAAAAVDGTEPLLAISCPSSSLCVATDDAGDVLTSTSPTGGAPGWRRSSVDGSNAIDGISCPTTGLCVAADAAGQILFSTNPTGGPSAWHATAVDSANVLLAISCPTAGLCVAVDDAGNVVSSADPTAGTAAWTLAAADPVNQPLEAVSCASASDCVAVDGSGNEINSLQPGGGADAWAATQVLSSSPLFSISCPSTTECVAGGGTGGVVVGKPTPSNTTPPSVSGYAEVGQALQETHGSWTDSPDTLDVFWERCDIAGANCTEIDQASGQTYMPTPSDAGHAIRAVEVASNSSGRGSPAESAPTEAIAVPVAATNSSPPTITGTARIGQTLSETHGNWFGHPASYRYQWQDCDGTGSACTAIVGATAQTYKITAADVSHRLRVAEYAVNAGGTSNPATSAATELVPVSPGTRGTAEIGRPTVAATSVRVRVGCAGGIGAICRLELELTVNETIRGTKPVAVAAATRRTIKRTIVLASARISLAAPQSATVRLTFSRAGKHLLDTFRRLPAKLIATQAGNAVWKATVTFKAKATPKHH